jgi:hypothetical protein
MRAKTIWKPAMVQLNAIARQYKFDAGMLLDDYLWTREFLEESMACSGCSRAEWVRARFTPTSSRLKPDRKL